MQELRVEMPPKILNSIPDVVARTSLSRSTVYEEMASGRLRSVKVGRRRLITESALVAYIEGLDAVAIGEGVAA
jgi:excisionase family DNA binding protein